MLKLDKIDKKLLFELDQNSRLPDVSISKKIGRSRESVRYRIEQLQKKGVIRKFTTIINFNKIGYQGYELYLNLTGMQKERDELRDYVKGIDNLFWVGVSEGSWDVGLTLFAKNHQDFFEIKQKLFQKFRHLILKKDAVFVIYELMFPKKYIHGKVKDPVEIFGNVENVQIKELDLKLLKILVHDARISLVKLAQELKSTVDIVRGRMKKLVDVGVIVKYSIDIDHNQLGKHLFKVFLYFKKLSKANEKKLIEYCKQKQEITHFGRYISPWEVELDIMTDTFQNFNKLIRDIKDQFADILVDTEASSVSEDYLFP